MFNNGRLIAAVWKHRSKSVSAGLTCCGLKGLNAGAVTIVPVKTANAALYK